MAEEQKLSPAEEENRRNVEAMQKAQKEQEEKDKKEHKIKGSGARETATEIEGDHVVVRSDVGANAFVRLPKGADKVEVYAHGGSVVVLPPKTEDDTKPKTEQPPPQVFIGGQSEIVVSPKGGAIFRKLTETEWGVIGAQAESVH
jgi:hypothetical protein